MLPMGIFASPLFRAANIVTFVVYAALAACSSGWCSTCKVVAGYSPLAAGVPLLPMTLIMLLLSARMGALAQRIGPRVPMTVGPLLCALGVAEMTRTSGERRTSLTCCLPSSSSVSACPSPWLR